MTTFEVMRVDGSTETIVRTTKAAATKEATPDATKDVMAALKAKFGELMELLTGEGVVMDATSAGDWHSWLEQNIQHQTDYRAGKTTKAADGAMAPLTKYGTPAHAPAQSLGAYLMRGRR